MKIGIHQPQYIPWLHYFLKIKNCDVFVILDTVNFQKNGIQNRNQIKTKSGKSWLTVPVKHKLGQKIIDVEISNSQNWKKKHFMTIDQFYNKSKFYKNYKDELEEIYNKYWLSLCDFNIAFIFKVLEWLNIKTIIKRSSELKVEGHSTDLIINICKELNSSRYISGLGGKSYLEEDKFLKNQIQLDYFENLKIMEYSQLYPNIGFFNDLSALDILFNCGNKWTEYLN